MRFFSQNMRSTILILSAMLLWTGTTVAQNTCTVSDAGSYEANGDYTWDGYTTNWDGNPVYENSSGYPTLYMHANSYGEWVINEDEYDADPYGYSTYYTNSNYSGDSSTPPASDWNSENGYYPNPTTSCGPSIPEAVNINLVEGCFSFVSMGNVHGLAIKSDGTLWACGNAFAGGLGTGATSGTHPLTQVGTDTDWLIVNAGTNHSAGIKMDGTLWTWGYNIHGTLGNGTKISNAFQPTQIGTDTDWLDLSLSDKYCTALKTDGTLWTWGNNESGKLGHGTTGGHVLVPTQVGTDTDWAKISAGFQHCSAIKTNGTLWTWGDSDEGKLGNGLTSPDVLSPTQIGTDTDWESLSLSSRHSAALKTDGTLWTWGSGAYGKLANGTTGDLLVPTQVGTDTDWATIAMGAVFSTAIKTNGSLWTWGDEDWGVLGLGSSITDNVLVPTQVGTETDWIIASAGSENVFALKASSLASWGRNENSEVGDGTTVQRDSPIFSSQIHVPSKGVSKTISSNVPGVDGDWTYYFNEEEGGIIFAINWAPDGSLSTANETARNYAVVTLDIMSNYHSSTNGADASFIMGRYWNVDTQGNSFDEPVNIRYYYDPSEITDIETAADNYATANSSPKREVQWFKLNTAYNPSSDNSATFNPAVYLTPSAMGGGSNCEKNYVQFDGLTSFSGGGAGVGVGAAFAGAPVLPVELLDFTGTLINDEYVQLDWQTASEINNKGFDIERSKDGQNWERIGYVEGNGNTTDRQAYQFNDYTPLNGISYYRLKQTDFDGSYEYTKTVTITLKQSNSLSIYPNPSRGGEIFVNFKEITTGTLNIYNAQGKLVSQYFIENAQDSYKVNLPNLGQGIFIAELSTGDEQLTSRFIIQE